MVSYKELIGFVWRFVTSQKWVFVLIFTLDAACVLNALIWPYEVVAKLRFSRISGSFEPIFDPFRVGNINMRI